MPLVPIKQFETPRVAAAAQVSGLGIAPAPVGGLNYRDPINEMPPTDAMVLDNFIPKRTGVSLRKGWQYHTSAITNDIESLFSYNGATPASNKLFAASNGDIYDVTTGTPSVSQASTGSTEDIWITTQFSNSAGTYLLAVSPGAGYWTYDGTSWTQQSVNGLPTDLTSVAVWKNRVWFTAENDSSVYYLHHVDVITGSATQFVMGPLLRNGGSVRAIINWTLDAGVGVDDYLVVIGSQGDVGVWQGTDPTSAATFGLKGVWYVGPVPKYGRFFTSYGGDVMVLSELGIVPMSRLVNGQFVEGALGVADKIENKLTELVSDLKDEKSWDILLVPGTNILLIKPPPQNNIYTQYAMSVSTGAWCTFSNMPMSCTAVLGDQFYFGTDSKTVAKGFYGESDAVSTAGTGGDAVQGDIQSSFNSFGNPGQLKKFNMVRPIFISSQSPAYKAQINTQYTFDGVYGSPPFVEGTVAEWDVSKWDLAAWSQSSNTYQSWSGVTGLGYYGALRMKVKGVGGGTTFSSYHVLSEIGGVM